ncbi:ABC transporter ATP-binding protein [Streptobacillus moniliformis]|nr:ABC transporter ATP-binding protein [Streptobacillus moniliformis]AVL43021.1 ABC transporter ATP-binding protein [Streptobacillus moniliformis]
MGMSLLEIKNLSVSFNTYAGEVKALRDISFTVDRGETLAIVGESGSGKSVTVQSIMKLIPTPPGEYKSGEIIFDGVDLLKLNEKEMRKYRGGRIGMIFQDPMTSLNPVIKIGHQIMEGILIHKNVSKKEAKKMAIDMLAKVGIPKPEERFEQYPHQFSGGMRQRVVIAIALACEPDLLICDEPTTALDVTIQAQILELINKLKKELNIGVILITHDLGVVAETSDRVIVMYAGEKMEEAPVKNIFKDPKHPYTWGLLKSLPRLDMDSNEALFSIPGTPPDLLDPPTGDPFAARSDFSMKIDYEKKPPLVDLGDGHYVKSWIYVDGAPDMKFNPDGTIRIKPVDGRAYIVDTTKSKSGLKFANIVESEDMNDSN